MRDGLGMNIIRQTGARRKRCHQLHSMALIAASQVTHDLTSQNRSWIQYLISSVNIIVLV